MTGSESGVRVVEGDEFGLESGELLCAGVELVVEVGECGFVLLVVLLLLELLCGQPGVEVSLCAVQLLLRALQLTVDLLKLRLVRLRATSGERDRGGVS